MTLILDSSFSKWFEDGGEDEHDRQYQYQIFRDGFKAGQANPLDGYKLVPIEPTVEMREFLCDCYDNLPQIEIYRQMLEAAPTPGKDKS